MFGDHYDTVEEGYEQVIHPTVVVVHPDYDQHTINNDLTLVKVMLVSDWLTLTILSSDWLSGNASEWWAESWSRGQSRTCCQLLSATETRWVGWIALYIFVSDF